MITVWVPNASAERAMGGLPDGFRADVWTGVDGVPSSADSVEIVIPPFPSGRPDLSVLGRLPRLRLIQLLSAGAEKVIPYVPPGVALGVARGAHDDVVAEWILTVILAQVRSLPRFVSAQRAGHWDLGPTDTLGGKTVLILGYGSIGQAVARLLAAFDVTVIPVARHARPGVASVDDLPALLPSASVVVLLVPLTDSTAGMVDASFLARMPDQALLVNAARGPVVNTQALMDELGSGRLLAALDVTDPEPLPAGHPLWSAPGLLLTPHVAGNSGRPVTRALALARAQLQRYAAGEPLHDLVGEDGY
jgi:phosphoglycerate dehydrogenase-like enzyme